jgi:hypothetical protein
VLSPACRVWLRSQVSQIDDLQVDIQGGSRQILGGTIPRVSVGAVGAVYQGLSLGEIDLVAENIRINLPQVVKGQALKLLEPIAVTAAAKFTESDLQASLSAPLLAQAVTDLLDRILATPDGVRSWQIGWQQLQIRPQTLILQGNLTDRGRSAPIELTMGLDVRDGHILSIDPLKIACEIELPGADIDRFEIDLGSDTDITELQLHAGTLCCHGRLRVNP